MTKLNPKRLAGKSSGIVGDSSLVVSLMLTDEEQTLLRCQATLQRKPLRNFVSEVVKEHLKQHDIDKFIETLKKAK